MAKEGLFTGWRKIFTVSLGVVYVLVNLWILTHIPEFFPQDQQAFWFKVMVTYLFLNTFMFANADLRNKLFNVKLIDFLPAFVIHFISGLVIYYFILARIDPLQYSLFGLLSSVPLWLVLLHGVTFAVTESLIFNDWLPNKIGHPWAEIVAGVFHLGIWSGGAVVVVIGASILFAFFSLIHIWFRRSKNDLAPVIAHHTAFNYIKLGLATLGG